MSRLYRKMHRGHKGMALAKEVLQKGIEIKKVDVSLYEEMIDLLILMGDLKNAEQYIWKLLDIDCKNEMGLRSLVATVLYFYFKKY